MLRLMIGHTQLPRNPTLQVTDASVPLVEKTITGCRREGRLTEMSSQEIVAVALVQSQE